MQSPLETLGPKTREKLLNAFGTEEALRDAAEALELDRFLAIRGISARRALDLIAKVRGVETFPFLQTPAARRIHEDILERIQALAHTAYAKTKVLLLHPRRDAEERNALLQRVVAARERLRQLPRERIAALLDRLPALAEPRPVFDSTKVVVVENPRTLAALEPFHRYCEVLLPDDLHHPESYDLILYVCETGTVEFEGVDAVHVVLGRPEPWQLFPESVVDFFRANESLLEVLLELSAYLSGLEVTAEALEMLGDLERAPPEAGEERVSEILSELNAALEERLSHLSLEGPDVLELLQRGLPPAVQAVFDEVLEEGRDRILRETGLRVEWEATLPLRLPEEEVARARQERRRLAKNAAFEALQRTAKLLSRREREVREAYRRVLEWDFDMALGAFALDYELQPPRWGDDLRLRGALHLGLSHDPEAQRVDYELGPPERVALLTGANSGGKTTLLETVAQALILGSMGLPVNAREARLVPLETCYYFPRQPALSAGALEGFLTTFMPLALDETPKIVLADELEAMTEPEAAAAMLAAFLEEISRKGSYAVVVTHAARAILQAVEVRVDGIEAKGLDSGYNLIVDRTPRVHRIAASTPELLLQRLEALHEGPEAAMYRRVLEKLPAG